MIVDLQGLYKQYFLFSEHCFFENIALPDAIRTGQRVMGINCKFLSFIFGPLIFFLFLLSIFIVVRRKSMLIVRRRQQALASHDSMLIPCHRGDCRTRQSPISHGSSEEFLLVAMIACSLQAALCLCWMWSMATMDFEVQVYHSLLGHANMCAAPFVFCRQVVCSRRTSMLCAFVPGCFPVALSKLLPAWSIYKYVLLSVDSFCCEQ